MAQSRVGCRKLYRLLGRPAFEHAADQRRCETVASSRSVQHLEIEVLPRCVELALVQHDGLPVIQHRRLHVPQRRPYDLDIGVFLYDLMCYEPVVLRVEIRVGIPWHLQP